MKKVKAGDTIIFDSVSRMNRTAEEFGITTGVVYELLKKNNIETVTVDYWKRVPEEAFF